MNFQTLIRKNIDCQLRNLYVIGSTAYGIKSWNQSDLDLIAVVNEPYIDDEKNLTSVNGIQIDIRIYGKERFQELLESHEISALECIFLGQEFKLQEIIQFGFTLDLNRLRSSISHQASHSFVKAKKKLTVFKDYDPYIGKKSLFHSLRVLCFGIQLAKYGRIIDFSEANGYWYEIVGSECNSWEHLQQHYQGIYNRLKSEFKKLAPPFK